MSISTFPPKPVQISNHMHLEGNIKAGEIREDIHFDDVDNCFTHEIKQDVEPTLEWVKTQHSERGNDAGKNKAGDFYLAARVEPVVVLSWLRARGLQWSDFKDKVIDDFLNDSDNAAFRVWRGRL